jgi:DNA-binding HxlR family transcriptional regulator
MVARKSGSRNGLSSADKQICDLVDMPASRNVQATGILVAVVKGEGNARKVYHQSEKYGASLPSGRQSKRHDGMIVQLLSAVASPRRLTMLKAMLAGADSYAKLRTAVGLSAGPLYYHLRELKSAGLVQEGQRDVYLLTPRGKHLLLIADCAVKLVSR